MERREWRVVNVFVNQGKLRGVRFPSLRWKNANPDLDTQSDFSSHWVPSALPYCPPITESTEPVQQSEQSSWWAPACGSPHICSCLYGLCFTCALDERLTHFCFLCLFSPLNTPVPTLTLSSLSLPSSNSPSLSHPHS